MSVRPFHTKIFRGDKVNYVITFFYEIFIEFRIPCTAYIFIENTL